MAKQLPVIAKGFDSARAIEFHDYASFKVRAGDGTTVELKCEAIEWNEGNQVTVGVMEPTSGLRDTLLYKLADGELVGEHFQGHFFSDGKNTAFIGFLVRTMREMAQFGHSSLQVIYPGRAERANLKMKSLHRDPRGVRAEVMVGDEVTQTSIIIHPDRLDFTLA